jgi:hypothetical protein
MTEATEIPVRYEWRRPDGNVLLAALHAPGYWLWPGIWPWIRSDEAPIGPVQVWLLTGGEATLIAETPGGPARMVLHAPDGRRIPFVEPDTVWLE